MSSSLRAPLVAALAVLVLPLALCGPTAGPSLLAQARADDGWVSGTAIRNRDGKEWKNAKWKIVGSRVRLKLSYGEFTFNLSDVTLVPGLGSKTDGKSEGGDAADEPEPEEDAGLLSWQARCKLVPPAGWEEVGVPKLPYRVQLRHTRLDATLSVVVLPAGPGYPTPAEAKRGRGPSEGAVQRFAEEVGRRFPGGGRGPNLRPYVGQLYGLPVYRYDGVAVTEIGNDSGRVISEARFPRFGCEYVISLSVSSQDAENFKREQIDRLFEAFSFLPPASESESVYSDLERGFSVRCPEGWTSEVSPFDDRTPFRARDSERRAQLVVRIEAGNDPESVLENYFRKRRRSRYFKQKRSEEAEVQGVSVFRYEVEDVLEGGVRQMRFVGIAAPAAVAGKVIVIEGHSQLTASNRTQLEETLDQALDEARVFSTAELERQAERSTELLASMAAGYAAYKKGFYADALRELQRVVKLKPDLAEAFYLRGLAKNATNDYEGAREDWERAAQLDPGGGYDKELGPSYGREGNDLINEGKFAAGLEQLERAFRATRDRAWLRAFASGANKWWIEVSKLKGSDLHRGVQDLEKSVRPLQAHDEIHPFLGKVYQQTANSLGVASRAKALRWARRLQKLPGDPKYEKTGRAIREKLEEGQR